MLDDLAAATGRCRDVDGTPQRAVPAGRVRDGGRTRYRHGSATTPRSQAWAPHPTDVGITGKLEVYNRCLADGGTSNCLALVNFWRTISNLSLAVNAAGQDGCRASANFWAVSQAVSMRRLDISGGNLSLMDYCTAGPQFASGGFIADSRPAVRHQRVAAAVAHPQQRRGGLVERSLEPGVLRRGRRSGRRRLPEPAVHHAGSRRSVSREKPYLFVDDDGRYAVRVPAAQTATRGITWADGETPGRTIPITDFYIARPGDSVGTINAQLARGKHLLLTPGVYDVASSINVKRADTVVLGMGHATLTAVDGAVPLKIADAPGIVIAGVTIDAGTVESPMLLQVGKRGRGHGNKIDPANPITLSDVYFRVGGPHIGKTDTALVVNSDHVLIDHTWVWRADHGIEGFTDGVNGDTDRWNTNTGRTGVVVNGDDVIADRPLRGALPTVQHRVERRARHHRALPERAAVRPAHPSRLDTPRRHARLRRIQGRR